MKKKILLVELMQEDVRIPVMASIATDENKEKKFVSELKGVRIFRSVNQDHEVVSQYDGKANKCYEDVNIFRDYIGHQVVAVSSPKSKDDSHHWVVATLNGVDEESQRLIFSGFNRASSLESNIIDNTFPNFLNEVVELSKRNITM